MLKRRTELAAGTGLLKINDKFASDFEMVLLHLRHKLHDTALTLEWRQLAYDPFQSCQLLLELFIFDFLVQFFLYS